ncbi:hypothetical protein HOLleu_13339 [Holothuria leucospilota]|uniref:Uncharacterized protein n=1 Tax=Holothuria leucospilota TaxID=206669 RepID=A0A9Q1HEM1_HOLLE|nr:hypothetical protein HOLleu_13339 [Holothuria leucospilota]
MLLQVKDTNHRTADKLAVIRYLNYHIITVIILQRSLSIFFNFRKRVRVPAIILPLIRVYLILVRLKVVAC